jgi:G3E family GTPase
LAGWPAICCPYDSIYCRQILHVVPVLQTFFVDDDLKDACQLDAVLTVVDSKHLIQHLDEVKPADVVNEAGGAWLQVLLAPCKCLCWTFVVAFVAPPVATFVVELVAAAGAAAC